MPWMAARGSRTMCRNSTPSSAADSLGATYAGGVLAVVARVRREGGRGRLATFLSFPSRGKMLAADPSSPAIQPPVSAQQLPGQPTPSMAPNKKHNPGKFVFSHADQKERPAGAMYMLYLTHIRRIIFPGRWSDLTCGLIWSARVSWKKITHHPVSPPRVGFPWRRRGGWGGTAATPRPWPPRRSRRECLPPATSSSRARRTLGSARAGQENERAKWTTRRLVCSFVREEVCPRKSAPGQAWSTLFPPGRKARKRVFPASFETAVRISTAPPPHTHTTAPPSGLWPAEKLDSSWFSRTTKSLWLGGKPLGGGHFRGLIGDQSAAPNFKTRSRPTIVVSLSPSQRCTRRRRGCGRRWWLAGTRAASARPASTPRGPAPPARRPCGKGRPRRTPRGPRWGCPRRPARPIASLTGGARAAACRRRSWAAAWTGRE